MSENDPTPTPDPTPPTPPTPTPTPEPTPAPTPEPTPQTTPPSNASPREVMDAVNALPDRIVNSLREAFQTPTPPASSSAPASTPPASTETKEQREPGKSQYASFAHRWFGIKS